MPKDEMPIFTETFELLTLLLRETNNFPKEHQNTLTKRLLDATLDLREHLEHADHRRGQDRIDMLIEADDDLERVRVYLRLSAKLSWLPEDQFQRAAEMASKIGRLLGGWQKAAHSRG